MSSAIQALSNELHEKLAEKISNSVIGHPLSSIMIKYLDLKDKLELLIALGSKPKSLFFSYQNLQKNKVLRTPQPLVPLKPCR